MRRSAPRSVQVLLLLCVALLALACRPRPSAEIEVEDPQAAAVEPSGRGGQAVFVEAAQPGSTDGPVLDWARVDGELSHLVEGERLRVDYDGEHPWLGARVPLVTMVVFSDYQCPYCKRLDESLVTLLQRYPDSLRVVWRQFPLAMHKDARRAAKAALAAKAQGMFAPMHDWLFANNRTLSRQEIEAAAASMGLDAVRFAIDMDSDWVEGRVAADLRFGGEFGVRGTPATFVNGRLISGAQPIEKFDETIREEIAVAERMMAAGAPRRELWARFMAAAADELPPAQPPTQPSKANKRPKPDKRYATQLSGLPERGASQAKIEILMCGDFDCPYSARSVKTLEALETKHPKQLAIYFRHMPLDAIHPKARKAHRAAVAAENQGEFWAMFELLYADPKKRSDAEIEAMAKQLGLNMKRFRADLAKAKTDERVDEQAAFCKDKLDVTGTPTFFVNGRPLVGAQPITKFEDIITEELAGKGPPAP